MKRCNNCGWFNLDSASCCEKCEDTSFEDVKESVESSTPESLKESDACEVEQESVYTLEVNSDSFVEQQEQLASESIAVLEEKQKNPMTATIAFAYHDQPVAASERPRPMSATIMGASSFEPMQVAADVSDSCPKCCYPISGNLDYCPNCGATVKRTDAPVNLQSPKRDVDNKSFAKKTVIASVQEVSNATMVTVMKSNDVENQDFKLGQTVPIGKTESHNSAPLASLKATVADISPSLLVDDSDCSRLVPVGVLGEPDILLHDGEEVIIHGQKYRFEK